MIPKPINGDDQLSTKPRTLLEAAVFVAPVNAQIRPDQIPFEGYTENKRAAEEEQAQDFRGKTVIYIEPEQPVTLEGITRLEAAMNYREAKAGSNTRYRILPYGMKIKDRQIDTVVVQCAHCGQFGALHCACPSCGAPITGTPRT